MLYMVIERFRNADAGPIGERFVKQGRMMPEGLIYHASWIDSSGACCFQVMESPSIDLLHQWISKWDDLMEFEIVPVLTSRDFWALRSGSAPPTA